MTRLRDILQGVFAKGTVKMKKAAKALKIILLAVMGLISVCAILLVLGEEGIIAGIDPEAFTAIFRQEDQPVVLPVSDTDTEVVSYTDEVVVQPVPETAPLDLSAQQAIEEIADYYDCMAVQIAVINDGYVTNTYSFGYADYASKRVIDDDTKVRVASLSKVLIGMAAMRAHEDGQLDLDASLTEQLGYSAGNPSYTSHVTTLRDILTHTATFNDTASIAGRSLQNFIQDRASYFYSARPGTKESWAYSNSGIRVAGGIIEVLTDTTMHDYTEGVFFEPLDIDASFYARLLDDTSNIATLYYGNGSVSNSVKQQLLRQNFDTPAGNCTVFAGGLTISAQDYARLMCILLRDGEYDGVQYLSTESVADMEEVRFELDKFDQCTVLRHRDDLYGRELYYHTGVAYGVLSFAAYDKNANEGVVIVTTGAYRTSRDEVGVPNVCAEMASYILSEVLDGENTAD